MGTTATRATWKNEPIDKPKRIKISIHFNERQFLRIKKGLTPHEMEDKWFIFYENDWLYFHRSWTGYGIFKAQIIKEKEGYSIKEFWAERNAKKYSNTDDNTDIQTFLFLITEGLLKIHQGDVFALNNIKSEADLVKGWSSFGSLLFNYQGDEYRNFPLVLSDSIRSVLFGVAAGDALGVPVEFKSREYLRQYPVKEMIGYGTHHQPPGTWSDDSSLTFCLAEALTEEFSLDKIGKNFIAWIDNNFWTPHGRVFDIGNSTRDAIKRLQKGIKPDLAGGTTEDDNGNGSLMRILPLVFYIWDKNIEDRYRITQQVSSITHRHIRSIISCFYYLEFARLILQGYDQIDAYNDLKVRLTQFFRSRSFPENEMKLFDRLLKGDIYKLNEESISSSGYVLHTLEASIWCLMTTNSYKEATLKAVNLGNDTDTTAAVTGGLAALCYGYDAIPKEWIDQLVGNDDIMTLANRMDKFVLNQYSNHNK